MGIDKLPNLVDHHQFDMIAHWRANVPRAQVPGPGYFSIKLELAFKLAATLRACLYQRPALWILLQVEAHWLS